jgi:predicted DNA-binding mobile mystery protein A
VTRSVKRTAREQFDKRFGDLRRAADTLRDASPEAGWLRSLRTLLEMSNRSVAQRVGVSHPTLLKLEKSEQSGTISLASLRKAAEALDADLVYAIVPRQKLGHMIGARARALAKEQVAPIARSMALEKQGVSEAQIKRQIAELAKELEENPRALWR